jgi:foldase protein PrsA
VKPHALIILTLLLASCATQERSSDDPIDLTQGLDRTDDYLQSQGLTEERRAAIERDRPPAVLQGDDISWDDLAPLLAEAAGPEVLEEVVLERQLERECRRRAVRITSDDLESERLLLIETLTNATPVPDEAQADRLLLEVRRRRALGPLRFESLLRRSAMLRALVRTEVVVSQPDIERAYLLRYGPSYPARLIVVPTARQAESVMRRIRSGESFGELAAEVSTDVSGARGGLIDPINPADVSWPEAIRTMVVQLGPGDVGDPVLIEGGFAIVSRDGAANDPEMPDLAEVRDIAERDARLQLERVRMTRLARQLIDDASLTVFEPAFRPRAER